MAKLSGAELDQRMRKILLAVAPETVLSSTALLVELGFSPRLSFQLCENVLKARAKGLLDGKRD